MDLPHLARVLDSTLSSDPQIREESSRFLLRNVLPRSDGLESLLLLSSSSSSLRNGGGNEGEQLVSDGGKLAAAVAFKNGIKKRWIVSDLDEEEEETLEKWKEIEPDAKARLRVLVLEKALEDDEASVRNTNVKNQLAEALQIIALNDLTCTREFPQGKWPELVPSLVQKIGRSILVEGGDSQRRGETLINSLTVANAIFKRFPGTQERSKL